MSFTVAIDGPAAAGKGTISKAVAAHFGFAHLDTGLLYRAVGRKALQAGEAAFGEEAAEQLALNLLPEDLRADDLRTAAVAEAASRVAVLPAVRAALVAFQIGFSQRDGGAVLDGRDIGTVICPDAEVKLFVTACAEVRAARRFRELVDAGDDASYGAVLEGVKQRDARDADRAVAPMKAAPDAVLIDTSEMKIGDAIARAVEVVAQHMAEADLSKSAD